jgi:diaminopimelate epimerase
MHGAGNDYVYLNGFHQNVTVEQVSTMVLQLSDRHCGIGADGVILLSPSRIADCRMSMWNSDGSRGSMCGNGIRCLAKLAYESGVVNSDLLLIETDSGLRSVELLRAEDQIVGARVDMGPIHVDDQAHAMEFEGRLWKFLRASAGNPHAVVFLESEPSPVPVDRVGAAFQELPEFPDGVNVEFVHPLAPCSLLQRTFERGSGETLACGSGATVAAVAAIRSGRLQGPVIRVRVLGGELTVTWNDRHAVLEGPAVTVFTGQIEVRGV